MIDFIERLKRARIVRVLAFYLGASWVILQVVDVLQEALSLPDWIAPVAVILLLIGLVIIAATAMLQAELAAVRTSATADADGAPRATSEAAATDGLEALPPASATAARLFTWKRAVAGGVLAFTGLFGLALILPGGPSLGPEEAAADQAGLGVAVLPFSVRGPDMDVWAEGMVDLLADNLEGAGGLRSIDPRTVMSRWTRSVGDDPSPDLETMLAVARSTGARYAVIGSAVAIGGEVRLSTDVYELVSGEPLGSGAAEGETGEVMGLVDRLSVETAGAILATGGGTLPALRHSTSLTTRSPAALRAYLEGEASYRRADFATASDAFRRAVAEDSTFALANLRLSRALGWLRNIGDRKAGEALVRARAHEDRLPPREAEFLSVEQQLDNQDPRAFGAAVSLARSYPDDPEAWELLGEANYHQGAEALVTADEVLEQFERAIELDPSFGPIYMHPIEIATGLGDSEKAYQLLAGLQGNSTEDGRVGRYDIFLDLTMGPADVKERAMARVREEVPDRELITGYTYGFRRTPTSVEADLLMAAEIRRRGFADSIAFGLEHSALLSQGRVDEALAATAGLREDTSTRLMLLLQWTAWNEVPQDPDARALVLSGPCPNTMGCFSAAVLAAEMDEWDRHEELLDSYQGVLTRWAEEATAANDTVQLRTRESELPWFDVARDFGRLRRGEIRGVPRSFRDARPTQPWANLQRNGRTAALVWWTAELLLESGDAEQALRHYDALWGAPLGAWYTLRLVGAGDALRAAGRDEEARDRYREFLDAWSAADPEHPLMRRAHAGLEAVGG
jgi:tetratricopeptide (TPR) repeat protein/TolB-like protein